MADGLKRQEEETMDFRSGSPGENSGAAEMEVSLAKPKHRVVSPSPARGPAVTAPHTPPPSPCTEAGEKRWAQGGLGTVIPSPRPQRSQLGHTALQSPLSPGPPRTIPPARCPSLTVLGPAETPAPLSAIGPPAVSVLPPDPGACTLPSDHE